MARTKPNSPQKMGNPHSIRTALLPRKLDLEASARTRKVRPIEDRHQYDWPIANPPTEQFEAVIPLATHSGCIWAAHSFTDTISMRVLDGNLIAVSSEPVQRSAMNGV